MSCVESVAGWYPKFGHKCNPNGDGSDDPVAAAMGWISMAACVFLFLSPVPTIRKVTANKTAGAFSDTPYIVGLTNCMLWNIYALMQGLTQPLYTNVLGAVCNSIYIGFFLVFHENRNRMMLIAKVTFLAVLVGVVFAASQIVLAQGGSADLSNQIVGISADFFNAGMYGAPLAALSVVIATRSVETMPLAMTLGCLVASLCWGTYAKWIGDYNMGLPNDAGLMLGIVQLIVYFKYRNASPDVAREKLVDGGDKVAAEAQA